MATATKAPRGALRTPRTADENRLAMRNAGVFALCLVGGPGCGKSTLVRQTLERLPGSVRVKVIVGGDCDADDASRGNPTPDPRLVYAEGPAQWLDAAAVGEALATLDLASLDLVLIENVGTLTLPADRRDLGQDATVTVFSVAAGDDKARKHHDLVAASDAVVLNKIDLLPAVPFDLAAFRRDVARANPSAALFEVGALGGRGLEPWMNWLRARVHKECGCSDVSHWFG